MSTIKKLCESPELAQSAAQWFASKWGIPAEAYRESIEAYISKPDGIPQWYVMVDAQGEIVAGAGVIQNDFHNRKDLSPNLCALYVEPHCRKQGLAGQLLDLARREVGRLGMERLYLLTDHTSFYERYGWEFLCMAQEDGGGMARVYVADTIGGGSLQ